MRGVFSMILLSAFCCSVPAREIIREGKLERLVLASGNNIEGWRTAEATFTSTTQRVRDGRPSMRFHVDVDHYKGEKNYPVGWPRALKDLKKDWERDWAAYDFLRFWVYTSTTRENLPKKPLGLIIYAPDKAHSYNQAVRGLEIGKWVEIEAPVPAVTQGEPVTRIQFHISESDYSHGDSVDFTIGEISLLRYAEPHLEDVALRPAVCFSDAAALRVGFRVLGIAKGETAEARVILRKSGRIAIRTTKTVTRGANEIILRLEDQALEEGNHTVQVRLGEKEEAKRTLRVVESPFSMSRGP